MSALPGDLPGSLPAGERVLWQGRPSWQTLGRRGFRLRALTVYLGALLAWYIGTVVTSYGSLGDAAVASLRMAGIATIPLALISLYAWATARSTLYTITNRRVMMKIGIAMPVTFNIPFAKIDSAGVKAWSNGNGDIALALPRTERLAYLVLWPHARPWRMAHVEPMLRCIPNAEAVGQILAGALADYTNMRLSKAQTAAAKAVRLPETALA